MQSGRHIYNRMRFVVDESQTPRFALYAPTKNKEFVKSLRGFSWDTLKLCDLLANIDIAFDVHVEYPKRLNETDNDFSN